MSQSKKIEIETEKQYQEAMKTLGKRNRPNWILRLVMNALESYRQARKIGWSRPHNKVGVTTFSSYELDLKNDRKIAEEAFKAARVEFIGEIDDQQISFLDDLKNDPGLMGFIFVHDREDKGHIYEGATFSFGRRTPSLPRFRDRMDFIVESAIDNNGSRGLTSVRTIIDPFKQPISKYPPVVLRHVCDEKTDPSWWFASESLALFDRASELHGEWSKIPEKQWDHWTSDYIDYFGPRKQAVPGTYFPTHVDEALELIG